MSYVATASAERVRDFAAGRVSAFALGLGVAPVLAVNGGFYATSWGWAALALAWAAILGLLLQPVERPSRPELIFIAGLGAFVIWTGLSMFWTTTQTSTMLEVERTLVYAAAGLAVMAVVRAEYVTELIAGVATAITFISVYALAGRVFPNAAPDVSLGGVRLASPVGYWNGLGLMSGMGALLVLMFATRGRSLFLRACAGFAFPGLVSTMYFTFGRGAWLSFFVGLVALVVLERRRIQFILAAAPIVAVTALAVWRISREAALTHDGATLALAVHEGRHVAFFIFVACVVTAAAALAASAIERGLELPRSVSKVAPFFAAGGVVAVVAIVIDRFGAPWTIARRAYHSFLVPTTGVSGDLNNRLFSLANNGRVLAWHAAWHAFESQPFGGIGAGAFTYYWNLHQPVELTLTYAHSLYLQTLAELGVVGLTVLVTTLLMPFVAARRVEGATAGALAAFLTYLVGAGVDWDWQLTGVTLCALLCAGAALATLRAGDQLPQVRLPLSAAGVISVIAVVGLGGNLLLAASGRSLRDSHAARAATDARRAELWAPWSAAPWQHLGDAESAQGNRAAALAAFRTAARKDPENEGVWLDLARAARGSERAHALDRAQQLNPLDTSVAQVRKELGDS